MRILIPLPSTDFDPTESSIPWKLLSEAGHEVLFATPNGEPGEADPRMVLGTGLGPWRGILQARSDARTAYEAMRGSATFRQPLTYKELNSELRVDGLILAGGHAPGMKIYLESAELQRYVGDYFETDKPLGAVCHGNIVMARSRKRGTDRSILYGRRVTALPAMMEMSAWVMTCLWLGRYYRTYSETVESEVKRALGPEGQFESGPPAIHRDSAEHPERGYTVRDRHLLTARWPGDIYRFTYEFMDMLNGASPKA